MAFGCVARAENYCTLELLRADGSATPLLLDASPSVSFDADALHVSGSAGDFSFPLNDITGWKYSEEALSVDAVEADAVGIVFDGKRVSFAALTNVDVHTLIDSHPTHGFGPDAE